MRTATMTFLAVFLLLGILAACRGQEAVPPKATPTADELATTIAYLVATSTPAPTATPVPTATPQPTATPRPTATPGPTVTPAPGVTWLSYPDGVRGNAKVASGPDSIGSFTLFLQCLDAQELWRIELTKRIALGKTHFYGPNPMLHTRLYDRHGEWQYGSTVRWSIGELEVGDLAYIMRRTATDELLQELNLDSATLEFSESSRRLLNEYDRPVTVPSWSVVFNLEGLDQALEDVGPLECPNLLE